MNIEKLVGGAMSEATRIAEPATTVRFPSITEIFLVDRICAAKFTEAVCEFAQRIVACPFAPFNAQLRLREVG